MESLFKPEFCSSLEKITLCFKSITNDEYVTNNLIGQFAKKCPNITSITVNGDFHNRVFPLVLGHQLKDVLPKFSKLESLQFHTCKLWDFHNLENPLKIASFIVQDCKNFGKDDLFFVGQKFTHLKSFFYEQILQPSHHGENGRISVNTVTKFLENFESKDSRILMRFNEPTGGKPKNVRKKLRQVLKDNLPNAKVSLQWPNTEINLDLEESQKTYRKVQKGYDSEFDEELDPEEGVEEFNGYYDDSRDNSDDSEYTDSDDEDCPFGELMNLILADMLQKRRRHH